MSEHTAEFTGWCQGPTADQPSNWQSQSTKSVRIFKELVEQCADFDGFSQGIVGFRQCGDACGPFGLSSSVSPLKLTDL